MNRNAILLSVLGAILLVAVWFFFLFTPKTNELNAVREETTAALDQQQQLRTELARLRGVRENLPMIEASLAAYQSLIPPDAALPALLRQLQTAADESGTTLLSVAPSLPSPAEAVADIQVISLAVELEGGYFQIVDFLRRIEDPVIVARGVLVDGLTLTGDAGEYPTLAVTLNARMFTTAPPAEAVAEETPAPSDGSPAETEMPTEAATAAAMEVR